MALTLQDFNKTNEVSMQQLRMDAFQPRAKVSPAANAETVNTIASYGAALDLDGQIDSVYRSITNQLSYSSSSATLDQVVAKWQENDIQGSMDMVREAMIDPNMSDQQKQELLYSWQTGQSVQPLAQQVGVSSLMAADEGENGEQEDIRVQLGEAYNEVNQYNAWAQQQINALNSEANPTFTTNVKSFIQSFIPFADAADQAFFEGLVGEASPTNTAQTLLLLGEGRDRLRKTLLNVPIDQRQKIVTGLVNTIKSMSGSLANDTVTLRAIQNLERMIVPGAYNDNDRWWDNAFAIMDDTILLSPLGKGARWIKGAGAVANEARVSTEIIERAERSAEAVADAAPLQIEFKPTLMDWASDVDDIVDGLPIEPTGGEITELRTLINNQINNANFDIDAVIENARMTDKMTSTQIIDLRQKVGVIRDKRVAFANQSVEITPPSIPEVRARQVSSNVQPTSIAMTYKDTNISKARVAHNAVLADDTGQAARILYGTSRENALAHDYLPEIGGNGRIQNKVEYDEASSVPDQSILRHVRDSEGASWADDIEKANVRKRVIDDWKNVVGLKNRSAMASIEDAVVNTDQGVRLNQVYGPEKGGFSNAYTAIDVVRAGLRKYGVSDDEIVVLARQKDGSYAPAKGGENYANGDFLIQVKYDYTFDPKEVSYTGYDVSKLWGFLRAPDIRFLNKEGGIVQQLVPKSVNIDPRTYVPGVVAGDRAAGIQKQFLDRAKEFAKMWKKLDKVQQDKVDEYIRVANEQEIPFSLGNIRTRGINDAGVEVLSRWKQLQDTLGYLENLDVARSLRDKGWEMFEHRASDTRLLAERVGRSNENVNQTLRMYDASTDTVITLKNSELDELYANGGSVMKLRQPSNLVGENIAYIVNRNTPDAGFSRRIRDDDRILNYRHGYYHVRYTDPYYVTKTDPKTGQTRVIARAENQRDARIEAQRLNDTKDGSSYDFKRDRADEATDNHIDLAINYGRSAQRVRGKRLERVGGSADKTLSDQGIESPLDSLTRSIGSISHRVSFRNVIDAEKRRWMAQWKNLSKKPGMFPSSIDEIKDGPGATEARHAFRHLEHLQDGYGNFVDDTYKAFLGAVSDITANSKSWAWVDKLASKGSKISPSTIARLTAFKLFLAANPIRQLPLQAAPGIVLVSSLNPTGWGRVLKNASFLAAWHRGVDFSTVEKIAKFGMKPEATRDMLEAYELSGMSAAVNAHVYLRDQVGRLADVNVAQKAASFLGKPLRIAQNAGFDAGEQTLMTLTWLSEYDRMTKKLGKTKLTGSERDAVTAKARALTGDMNKGGEMPYNSNSFSVLMQFLQTPHKISAGLMLGHRGLTRSERARVAAGYTVAFGIPVLPFVNTFVDKIVPPDQPETRDIITGGLTNMILNRFLSSLSGEQTRVDFSGDFQPWSLEPMTEFLGGLLTLNVQDFLMDRASISLVTGNGRIANFLRAATDWITPGSYENVDEAKQVGLTFLQMFSGVSNTMKAMHIMNTGKITTTSGQVVDEDVSYMETLMKAGGFQTMDEVKYWAGNTAKWEIDGKIDADIEKIVDELFVRWTREGIDPAEMEQFTAVLKTAAETFNNNPAYLEKVGDYYKFKMRQNPDALYRLMLNNGLYKPEEVVKVINNSNFSTEQRETLMEMYNISGDSYGS